MRPLRRTGNVCGRIVAALLVLSPVSAATFFNGDFESPGGNGTTYLSAIGGTQTWVTGWVHDGGSDISEFYTGGGVWGINAWNGNNYVGFGASGGLGGSLSQTFDTVAGERYVVWYFLATQEFGPGTPPVQVAEVEALDAINGNALLASVSNSFATEEGVWFYGLELAFTAGSTSTTLRFTEQSTDGQSNHPTEANGVNWALDGVSVGVVPEPSSFVLGGFGLGALLALRRRQCRRR